MEFVHSPAPGVDAGQCLLLVHIRKVVGQVTYRVCEDCARGVITDVVLEERFEDSGLGTRTLSHLRARHLGIVWRSTLSRRATRALLHRMRIPRTTGGGLCPHTQPSAVARAGE
ncbi:N-acetyltransferase [Streptomyces sp. 8N706]|uniref:N-acetyltransferase n=1 Tax=Streptomyces sp. 8N706 TaxID=3457416 RepID=UPI003FD69BDB